MNELFVQLANGKDVVNAVIENQMGMAKSLAIRFMMTNRNRDEDILSTAYTGLVYGVNWIYDHPDENFTVATIGPFLNRTIRNDIIDYLNDDIIISIPRRTIADHLARGSDLRPPTVFHWSMIQDSKFTDVPDNKSIHRRTALEIRTELDTHLTHTERTVLDLKLRGYNQYEIADMMSCSQPWIAQVVGDIREKYTTLSIHGRRLVSLS